MKRIVFFLCSVIIMTSLCTYAQGAYDGNDWKLLNRYIEGRTMRQVLLQGIYEGAAIMQEKLAKEVYSASGFESLASMVDEFYGDDNNLSIPVTHAFYVVSMKLKNKPKAEIDEAIKKFKQGYRMQFIKPETKTKK